jgi:phosphomannomutase
VVADDFTYENLRYVAQGSAEYLMTRGDRPTAVVGFDCRFSAEEFAGEFARVLAGNGVVPVLFDRPSPTQVVSWTVIARPAAGGVAITASHNPYTFNGVKYKPETGSSAPPELISELERRINALAERGPDAVRTGDDSAVERYDPKPAYFEQLGRMVDLEKLRSSRLRLLHDCMYGSGYGYLIELLSPGHIQVEELHGERNPYFGGRNPEPIPPNLGEALSNMGAGGHDLCVATDGDADRLGIIDETGRFITQLEVYALLMVYLFEMRGWKGPVVKTINMTSMVERLAAEYGVEVVELAVGFKNVAPKMIELDAVLGGEESGGFGFRGHIPERDGILAGLFFADMVVSTGKPLSRLLAELQQRVGPHHYARHDLRLPRATYDQDRRRVLETLGANAPRTIAGRDVVRTRDDDGFKFYLDDGSWVLLRTSGTEPLIRVYAEAADEEAVEQRLSALEQIVGLGGQTGG